MLPTLLQTLCCKSVKCGKKWGFNSSKLNYYNCGWDSTMHFFFDKRPSLSGLQHRHELSRETHSRLRRNGGGRHGLAAVGARSLQPTWKQPGLALVQLWKQSNVSVAWHRPTVDGNANQSSNAQLKSAKQTTHNSAILFSHVTIIVRELQFTLNYPHVVWLGVFCEHVFQSWQQPCPKKHVSLSPFFPLTRHCPALNRPWRVTRVLRQHRKTNYSPWCYTSHRWAHEVNQ